MGVRAEETIVPLTIPGDGILHHARDLISQASYRNEYIHRSRSNYLVQHNSQAYSQIINQTYDFALLPTVGFSFSAFSNRQKEMRIFGYHQKINKSLHPRKMSL